jgi:hypothetical protein
MQHIYMYGYFRVLNMAVPKPRTWRISCPVSINTHCAVLIVAVNLRGAPAMNLMVATSAHNCISMDFGRLKAGEKQELLASRQV